MGGSIISLRTLPLPSPPRLHSLDPRRYSFYKNITLTLVLFYYCFYTGFSGTSLYESTAYMLFNVCFCSLPIIGVGWFDKDMSEETVLAFPEM